MLRALAMNPPPRALNVDCNIATQQPVAASWPHAVHALDSERSHKLYLLLLQLPSISGDVHTLETVKGSELALLYDAIDT